MNKLKNKKSKRKLIVKLLLERVDYLSRKRLRCGINVKEYKEYKSKIRTYETLRWGINKCYSNL